jgi:hypothetical protein
VAENVDEWLAGGRSQAPLAALPMSLRLSTALAACALAAQCACSSIGPGTVARDRAEYSDSISESRRQTLLNVIKCVISIPVFVDVG